ncbi:MtrB/PioB family decaheme-associated outer membrane protein [Noviherbaspirillum denitrificans]|uniref:MtrB/PioB family decaheme-associated outer membrane protein n=1 Tax=Noviherbaspirillum denitrificans TaxID=1968433 RepID=A0A254TA40_9BURK|nr:MtrB/PioB family decaheme-associated outer membrane protein [Noviherbaspirillum denitrificans]OWW19516.1 hypothetical protein AYR66_08310 [Noviherbaspirillum denitrificans]
MKPQAQLSFPLAVMAAALLAAFPAHADDEIDALVKPTSSVAVGAGYVSKDAPRFGQYSGLNQAGTYGLLNLDYRNLDQATGTWLRFRGNNLGLDSRDMRLQHERQGDWAYFFDYTEIPRFEPYTANTAVSGIGTPNLTIPAAGATLAPFDMKMKREALGFGFSKFLGNGFDVQVRLRNEEKNGERIFARGNFTPAFEFTPEPINSTTRQIDAILGYTDKSLQVQGSYYGTSYNNHNTALNIAGGNAGLQPFSPIGLPPDSQSHQLALTGGYNFTTTTRGTFKLAYTRAEQNDTFLSGVPVSPGISPTGNLGGRMDTTQMQVGVSSRPIPKLSLVGDLRYEDRHDKTPIRLYTTNGVSPTTTFSGENEPRSIRTTKGLLEASYRLPMSFRVTGGVDYVEKERNTSAVRVVSFRDKTEETSWRVGVQRAMMEAVTGSITYIHSDRNGSPFYTNVLNCGAVTCGTATAFNLIAPLHLSDRTRDKLRASFDWTPMEDMSVQYVTEQTRDDYANRTVEEFGLRDGRSRTHSLDVSYSFSDEWQGNAWVSNTETSANRADRIAATNTWASTVSNNGRSYGVGLRGKPFAKWDVGMDLSHSDITDEALQWALTGPAVTSLPSFYTRQTTLKLFTTYALQKNASLRFDFIHDRFATNDWSWATWTYFDGTTLRQSPRQYVNFMGVTYIYRFQ